jgi:hypothetical protein
MRGCRERGMQRPSEWVVVRFTLDDERRERFFCVLCTAIRAFRTFSRGFLGCHLGKLIDVTVACCKQSGNDSLAGFCELVAMSAGDFLQDAVSS